MDNRLADARINSGTNCCRSCKKTVKIGGVDFELKWGRKWKLCYDLAEIVRISFIWQTVVVKRIGIWQFWFQALNGQSILYILWKVGEIGISDAGVLGERSCTCEVGNCWTHVSFTYVNGWSLLLWGLGMLRRSLKAWESRRIGRRGG